MEGNLDAFTIPYQKAEVQRLRGKVGDLEFAKASCEGPADDLVALKHHHWNLGYGLGGLKAAEKLPDDHLAPRVRLLLEPHVDREIGGAEAELLVGRLKITRPESRCL